MPKLIYLIAKFLYDQLLGQSVRLAQIYAAFPGRDELEIGEALHRMREQRLIDASFQNDLIRLSPTGRDAWNDASIVEQSMGMDYVRERYSASTVHIIVRGPNGEYGGSGFFSADYPGCIVTAAHVLRNLEIVRIVDRKGETLGVPPLATMLLEGPDLALIECQCPLEINPVRIEWQSDALQAMERLLVLGYPAYPNLRPALDNIIAELRQVALDFRGERDSLVMSSATLPGSSGGPVISRRGRAIGVVEQENIAERLGEAPIHAFTATPARYLSELRDPSPIPDEVI